MRAKHYISGEDSQNVLILPIAMLWKQWALHLHPYEILQNLNTAPGNKSILLTFPRAPPRTPTVAFSPLCFNHNFSISKSLSCGLLKCSLPHIPSKE